MNRERFGHVVPLGRFQKPDQSFSGCLLVMMAGVTCIRLFIKTARLQGGLGKHESEGVAVRVPGLADPRHLGHVAANTATKGVNPVGRAVPYRRVATFAQPVLKQPGLGDDGSQQAGSPLPDGGDQGGPRTVDVVAGDTDHTHLGVFALLPVEILLVAVSGFPARPKNGGVIFLSCFVEIEPDIALSLAGLVGDGIGVFPGLVPAPGVAGAANLSCLGRG
ncbi:MAG: hypothetical protein V3W52_16690 [Syntrophobacteria bacterium]